MKVKNYSVHYDSVLHDVTIIFVGNNNLVESKAIMPAGEAMRLGRDLLNVLDSVSENDTDNKPRSANDTGV